MMNPLMRCGRLTSVILMAGVLLALSTSVALGQALPNELIESTSPLRPEQVAQIDRFVADTVRRMTGADERASADAARDLSTPLTRRAAGRPFHTAYDTALTPRLAGVLADASASIPARVAAAHILGSLASDTSLAALQSGLRAPEQAVRYAVASGYERVFQAMAAERALADRQRIPAMAARLREAIETEANEAVLHAQIAACAAAPMANIAVEAITKGLQVQFKAAAAAGPNDRFPRYQEGLQTALNRYLTLVGTGQSTTEPQKQLVETAAMAIQLCVRHGQAGKVTPALAAANADLVRTSENVLNVLCDKSSSTVSQAVGGGRFDDAAKAWTSYWLAPAGPIYTNTAWRFPAGHFDKLLGPGG